jgi:hypothetical protein
VKKNIWQYRRCAAVAQPVEQRIRNAWVGGSNPLRGTTKFFAIIRRHSKSLENANEFRDISFALMRSGLLVSGKLLVFLLESDSLEKGDTNMPLKDVAVRNAKPTEKCLESCPTVVDFTFSSSPQYRLSYWGDFLGSYDTAKQALKGYNDHGEIRPNNRPKSKGRYTIRDGKKEITLRELRQAAKKE